MMPNLLQYPVALFGVLRAGMVVVNVNPLYTPRELEHQLKDCRRRGHRGAGELRAHAGAGDRRHAGAHRGHDAGGRSAAAAEAAADERRGQAREEDGAAVAAARRGGLQPARWPPAAHRSLDEVTLSHDDLAFLQYTGGTTGVAKGAMLTHGNMVANVLQVARLDVAQPERRRGDGGHPAAAVSRVRAHGVAVLLQQGGADAC